MNKIIIISLGIIVAAVGGWLVVSSKKSGGDQPESIGESGATRKAPDFRLENYEGEIVGLADFAGTPLVINSWAAWCPFCKKELKDFAAAQKEFGDRVIFIAIDRAESLQTAKKYSDELGVTDELILLLDPKDSFYQSIGGFSMPETIFVDENGNIADHKRGPMDAAEIRERAQKILIE